MPTSRLPRFGLVLFVVLCIAAVAGACGSSNNNSGFTGGGQPDGSTGDDGPRGRSDAPSLLGDATETDGLTGMLTISPANTSIAVPYGMHAPTVTFKAYVAGV